MLHVTGAPKATIVGDLTSLNHVADEQFDCVILTQTLHLVYDLQAAVRTVHRLLKPGGVVLATVPGITPIDRGEWGTSWYWALTELAARQLFSEAFAPDDIRTETWGNVFTALSFLHGIAREELPGSAFSVVDPCMPVIVTVRAERQGNAMKPLP